MDAAPEIGRLLGPILVALTTLAAVLVRLGGLALGREVVGAALHATAQLAAVSLLIAVVLRSAGSRRRS